MEEEERKKMMKEILSTVDDHLNIARGATDWKRDVTLTNIGDQLRRIGDILERSDIKRKAVAKR